MKVSLLLCVLAALLTVRVQAAPPIINAIILPTYAAPGYVISADSVDGDPTTNRHRIETLANIDFGAPPPGDDFAVKWRLLDPNNVVIGSGVTLMGTGISGIKNVSGFVTASATLTPGTLYRVRAIVVENTVDVSASTEAPGHTFIHLAGTDEATAAMNAVSVVNSATISRSWLLDTDATKTTIPVSVNYTLYRYDHWTSASAATLSSVPATFTARIIRTSDNAVMSSTTTNNTASVPMFEFTAGTPKTPDVYTPSAITIDVDPGSVLAPDNYSIEVTISHLDTSPSTTITGNTVATASSQLLEFSGAVNFGSINTTATSFGSAPAVYGGAPADVPGSTAYRTISISAASVDGTSGAVTYTSSFNVQLDAAGTATVLSGSTTATGGTGSFTVNGVDYTRGSITLNSTGAHATLTPKLPAGVGWAATTTGGLLDNAVAFGTQDLNQTLDPVAAMVSVSFAPGSFFLCEETKPVFIEALTLQWDTINGAFNLVGAANASSIVKPLMDALNSYTYADPAIGTKRSNHFVYNTVTTATNTTYKRGTSGGGEMSTQLSLTAGSFSTHFPYDAAITWNGAFSTVKIAGDLIDPTGTTLANTAGSSVALSYAQHCQEVIEGACGGSTHFGTASLTNATASYSMTADGGISLSGGVTSAATAWGYNDTTGTYAQQLTSGFATGNFLMAGTFLRGDMNALTDEDGAGVLLLSGFDPSNLSSAERPSTTPYLSGLADYPGVNFRCSSGGPYNAQSRISGTVVGPYALTSRSKYYARFSGVSGIHESPTGPGGLAISGYLFNLTSFGFSYLSNEMEDSRTAGSLALPAPTNFTVAFDEMHISCLGVLEDLKLSTTSTGTDAKEFDAWNALFTMHSVSFEPGNPCDAASAIYMNLGFSAHASHFDDNQFVGSLGIMNTGHFTRPSDAAPVPSRLTLAGSLQMTGTTGEKYTFMPNQGAYFNDDPTGDGEGFWSLFGKLDVPFFDDMKVHVQTRCGYVSAGSVAPETVSGIYIMGGWPSHGWTEAGLDPFASTTFDQSNQGHGGGAVTLASYRDQTTESYLPRAQKLWLGVVNFDYGLKWSNTAFNFTGFAPVTNDLLVLTTEHNLEYLDAEHASITFGVQYSGLPEISISNMVFNAVDDATGVSSAMITAAGDKVFDSLSHGVDELGAMLSDQVEDLIGDTVKNLTDPVINDLLDQAQKEIKNLNATGDGLTVTEVKNLVDARFRNVGNTMTTELNKLANTIGTANSMIKNVDDRLAKVQQAISAVISVVTIDPNTGATLALADQASGLLQNVDIGGGEMQKAVFMAVATQLIDVLQSAINSSAVGDKLNELLASLDPQLEAVRTALTQVNSFITDVRAQLSAASDFGLELQTIVANASAQISTAITTAGNYAEQVLNALTLEDRAQIDSLLEDLRSQIAQTLTDAIFGSQFVADIQEAIKERIYDLQSAFNSAVDTAFAALNRMIRSALSEVLAGLDDKINGMLGDVNQYCGSGSLTGYAHINGDSLDELRIDGNFQIKVPDDMTLAAYLEVKELHSDGPAGCTSPTGGDVTEVTIGALDIPLGWVGVSGDSLHADLGVKFALDSTSGYPIGLGGSFELTQGTISFETFKITDIGASVMFGAVENYLAAHISMEFGEYAMSGGVFFGHSCTIDPLEAIDPLVASVLTMPSFTGVYCYGEATFPIYGTGTCLFNISGKAGAGVFYFTEGPTYGGRLTMGVYGEALCAVEIGGDVSLVGLKSGDSYAFAGTGHVYGKAGPCPVCIEADLNVGFNYTDAGGWKVSF